MSSVTKRDGARDFDFLLGRWKITNHRLKERLVGCDEWISFDATLEVWPILGGNGNVDEFRTELNGREMIATTLRIYNPESREWRLYWVDNWTNELQPPPVGSFSNGRGEFYTPDKHEDLDVTTRFLWTGITEVTARWEQAFSPDDGETWETNWVMEFERLEN